MCNKGLISVQLKVAFVRVSKCDMTAALALLNPKLFYSTHEMEGNYVSFSCSDDARDNVLHSWETNR